MTRAEYNRELPLVPAGSPIQELHLQELIQKTLQWAADRNLLDNSGAERQALKAMSELGEFADEILKGDKQKQICECGDVLVTLILTSHKLGFTLEEALLSAYTKINNRKGTTVNGVFIKEEAA
jgi:NTP pyrophosphatase (non-canonical NTP hydrolase)